jgi:hypothetical protein
MIQWKIFRLIAVMALPILCALGETSGTPAAESDSKYTTHYAIHVVRKGETIRSIGMAYGVSLAELRAANSFEHNTEPSIGDSIRVPTRVYTGPVDTNEVEFVKCGTFSQRFGCSMFGP